MESTNKISIASSTKNLSLVRKFVEQKAKEAGLNSDTIDQIILSVDEACTNIIKYSHKYNNNQFIDIEINISSTQFKVKIDYRGKKFDPSIYKVPDITEHISKHKVGGLGILLIRKNMNKIEYIHTKPDNNSLTLVKTITS